MDAVPRIREQGKVIRKSIFGTSRHQLQHRVLRSAMPLLWLVPTLVLSYVAAFQLRFDGAVPPSAVTLLLATVPLVVVVKTGAFLAAQMPLSCHAFVSLYDAYRLVRGSVFATACVAMLDLFWLTAEHIPRGAILIDCCLTTLLIGGILTFRRVLRERRTGRSPERKRIRVLVVGGPTAVELMLRSMAIDRDQSYQPIGILTSLEKMLHRSIGRTPVLGRMEDLDKVLEQVECDKVMLSGGDLAGTEVRQIIATVEAKGIEVCIVPDVSRMMSGKIDFRPREVAIEDLLGRPAVTMDENELGDWIDGKRVLVTGSCGSIGSELARQLLALNPQKVILVDRSENGQFHLERELSELALPDRIEVVIADINDQNRMESIFKTTHPEIVFHAAAYKHVPLMEQNPSEGVKNIVGATKNLADLADACGVQKFVLISTDKAVNPSSVMGCCKRIAELYVQSLAANSNCQYITVRFGNVMGSAGSVIPIFREQIAKGGPITVTHPEITRFFMTIPEASRLVIQAARMGHGGEIFVLDMGSPVKIMDLAKDLIHLSGLKLDHDIEIVVTGLRPGEKLYEELYSIGEEASPTEHEKILKANSIRVPYFDILRKVTDLLHWAETPIDDVRLRLKEIVPAYAYSPVPKRSALQNIHGLEQPSAKVTQTDPQASIMLDSRCPSNECCLPR